MVMTRVTPAAAARNKTASVVDRRGPRRIGREHAHDAERIREQQRKRTHRHAGQGDAGSELRYEKTHSNIVEVKARDGIIVSVLTEGDTMSSKVSNHVIEIPETSDLLGPILSIVPLQLLSYHIAVRRGCDVDQPRNLAKSVTVE